MARRKGWAAIHGTALPAQGRGRGRQHSVARLTGRKREAEAALPEELIRLTNLVGPASWVAERVAAYREAGVTVLHGPDPLRNVEQLKELVA